MKTITKILILLVALIVAVGAVMIFYSTIALPPKTPEQEDVYKNNLYGCVGEFRTYRTKEEMDALFKTTMERIKIFNDEKKITSEFAEERLCDMTGRYVPAFLKYWDARFSENWKGDAIRSFSEQKDELTRIKHFSNGREVLSEYITAEYSELTNIVPNYYEANNLCKGSYSYSTYNNAKNRADKIKEKKNDKYLSHNSDLVSRLDDALKRMEESHYSYVSSLVDKLNNYVLVKRVDYDALYSAASKAITEYKEYAKELYGSENSEINPLIRKFNAKHKEAQQHYNRTSEISNVRVDVKYPSATSSQQSLKIKRVRLTDTKTIVDLEYVSGGGWCNIEPSTYIRANDRTYKMTMAEGIPISPIRHYFSSSSESLLFTLIFPALPSGITQFDLIENSTISWKFYGIKLSNGGKSSSGTSSSMSTGSSSSSANSQTGNQSYSFSSGSPNPSAPVKDYINHHECVDLGLSVKWATCNVGASIREEEYGDYYAWGEITKDKHEYTENNSVTFGKKMKNIAGDFQYDVARLKWGAPWRLPTEDEIRELLDSCTWKWEALNGIKGYRVTGPNGNSIFLPAAGFRDGKQLSDVGRVGRYWSASPVGGDDYRAYSLEFDESKHKKNYYRRFYGRSIRPVAK